MRVRLRMCDSMCVCAGGVGDAKQEQVLGERDETVEGEHEKLRGKGAKGGEEGGGGGF